MESPGPREEDVARLVDPAGKAARVFAVIPTLETLVDARPELRPLLKDVKSLREDQIDIVQTIMEAAAVFAPRGWLLFESMSLPVIREALAAAKIGDIETAESALSRFWEEVLSTERVARRLRMASRLPAPDIVGEWGRRAELVEAAARHHRGGAYEASIPLLLAQVEGITADAARGALFFSKWKRADVVDDSRLVSLRGVLDVARDAWSQPVDTTQATGAWSRHGVVHGRELGYASRVNSARAWSLLDGVLAWALQRAKEASAARA